MRVTRTQQNTGRPTQPLGSEQELTSGETTFTITPACLPPSNLITGNLPESHDDDDDGDHDGDGDLSPTPGLATGWRVRLLL